MTNKLELVLRKAGRELADWQVARFFKVPEEMAQTPCDFFGYTAIGRAILIEAKMVNKTSLPIGDSGHHGLASHQWNELADANRAGALSLIAWARGDICAVISFDVALALAQDRKSIPWEKIEGRFLRPLLGPHCHLTLLDHWLPLKRQP